MGVFMVVAFFAFIFSAVITRLMIAINIQDVPQERSSHQQTTPRAGGVAIVLTTIGFFLWQGLPMGWLFWPLYLSAIFLVTINFLDDIHDLPQRWRFLPQLFCALALIMADVKVELTILNPGLIRTLLETILTISGVIFTINATNFLDGLNGLLSGTLAIALISYVVLIDNTTGSSLFSPYVLFLLASMGGFFIFNFPKARIFMGDVGSTFLGLLIAFGALKIQTFFPHETALGLFNRGFILALFPLSFAWFDIAFTLLRRLYLRRSLLQAHREHLFQILNRCGYTHPQISGLYFLATALLGCMAYACAHHQLNFTYCFFAYLAGQVAYVRYVFAKGHQHHLSL